MGCDQNCLIGETFWPRFFHGDVNSTLGTSALLFAAVNSAKFRSKVFISSCYAAGRINMWSTNWPSANFWLSMGTLITFHWVWQVLAKRWTTKAKKEAGRMQPTHVLCVQRISWIMCPHWTTQRWVLFLHIWKLTFHSSKFCLMVEWGGPVGAWRFKSSTLYIYFFPMAMTMGILSADNPCSVATSRKQPIGIASTKIYDRSMIRSWNKIWSVSS